MLINLHSHLEGRVRPRTAAELAKAVGAPEPTVGWDRALMLEGPGNLTTYLEKVAASYPLLASAAALERVAREAVEDAAAGGHDYLEVRFGPATHVREGTTIDDVVRAVVRGLADGAERSGIHVGAVIAILRHHDAELNLAVARSAARFAGAGVVGFDLAGDELRFPSLESHRDAFRCAQAAGLGLTCHAAEAAPGAAAKEAVEVLGVTRIGHGVGLAADRGALAWIAGEGVAVEICPTSNWYTGAISHVREHPASLLRDGGVQVVLGDDNPLQTGSDLAHERSVLQEELGWTAADLRTLDESSIHHAFVEPAVRAKLRAKLR